MTFRPSILKPRPTLAVAAPLLALLATFAAPAHAALKVLACEPEWGALRRSSAATWSTSASPPRDAGPHQVQAKPSLIARARNADLVACTGAELEIGWLPVLLQQSGNREVQPGQPGNFAAADFVRKLDVPTQVDRAQGDVHAPAIPHIQTDPRNIALVATALGRGSRRSTRPMRRSTRSARPFSQRWQQAMQRWTPQAAPLKGVAVAAQHKAYCYCTTGSGLRRSRVLEPKPGVEPSASHLQECCSAEGAAGEDGAVSRLPGSEAVRVAERRTPASRS
jgi:zinc/manganese transport system substrate-binding protein